MNNMRKRRRLRWQVWLIIAFIMMLIGFQAQIDIAYDQGRADQAYEEIMSK